MLKITERLSAKSPATLVAFGDSNTELTFHTRGRLNWVGLLAEALFETYGNGLCTVINAGKCGSTVRDSLGRLERDVLRFSPDLVILAFGMNDAGKGLAGVDAFKADVRETIRRIREKGADILIRTPNPMVTVNGLPLPPEQPQRGKAWDPPQRPVREYAAALVEVAAETGCSVVDHYTLWAQKRFPVTIPVADPNGLWMRMSDAIHPNGLGHLAFFRELAPLFGVPLYFSWEDVGSV